MKPVSRIFTMMMMILLPPRAWHNVLTWHRLLLPQLQPLKRMCFLQALYRCWTLLLKFKLSGMKTRTQILLYRMNLSILFFSYSGEAFVWKQGVFLIANVASECGYTASGSSEQRGSTMLKDLFLSVYHIFSICLRLR
jgi:hypothetical protein